MQGSLLRQPQLRRSLLVSSCLVLETASLDPSRLSLWFLEVYMQDVNQTRRNTSNYGNDWCLELISYHRLGWR